MDKFALVYEFNKDSPLMTYKASRELEAKNYPKALELLTTAIEKYPFHATAYFLYALALAHNNQFNEAKEMLSIGDDLLGEKNTAKFYTNEIEKIRLEKQGISVNFDDTVNDVLDEAFIEPNEFNPVEELALIDDEIEFQERLINQTSDFCLRILNIKCYEDYKKTNFIYDIINGLEAIGDRYYYLYHSKVDIKGLKETNEHLKEFFTIFRTLNPDKISGFARDNKKIIKLCKSKEVYVIVIRLSDLIEPLFALSLE